MNDNLKHYCVTPAAWVAAIVCAFWGFTLRAIL